MQANWRKTVFTVIEFDDFSLEYKRHFEDNATAHIGDISSLASATISGRVYFFASSSVDVGISSYWIGKWGNIKHRDSYGLEDGASISAPSVVETTIVGGKDFLLLGSAGTNSITVLRVNTFGGLFLEDQIVDTTFTRFQNVEAIESFLFSGRSFILAGGSDDGLSLFELAPSGQLFHLHSIADQLDTSLNNISSIAAVVHLNEVQVFVAGTGEAGITQFTLDLGNIALPLLGTDAANTLTGGTGDDLIMGFDGADTLNGGQGNDRIIDGAGVDIMTGDAGADIFVFVRDARMDTVLDFTFGEDRLDLSAFTMLYSVDGLTITGKAYGALITSGAERIHLETFDHIALTADDFSQDDFIFGG